MLLTKFIHVLHTYISAIKLPGFTLLVKVREKQSHLATVESHSELSTDFCEVSEQNESSHCLDTTEKRETNED